MRILTILFGLFIIIYFTFSSISWGRFDIFNLLVSLCGAFLIFFAIKLNLFFSLILKLPKAVKIILLVLLSLFLLSYVIVNSLILASMRNASKLGADYVLVLGCQVVGQYASLPLLQRGYTAIRYLRDNGETTAVLSGGQGPGERITEAESLSRLMRENGIQADRFLLEEKSRNTTQNLVFSNELYGLKDKKIALVTSDYHMFRALRVAKKAGYTDISALPARSQKIMIPAYMTREYVTVMYYLLTGKL
jgi:uncharacterized SAM-binding protein YcdF (DUF218 family)